MKIIFSEEIKRHKRLNYPILALESTILAHGMPYPNNYTFAKKTEDNTKKGLRLLPSVLDGRIGSG